MLLSLLHAPSRPLAREQRPGPRSANHNRLAGEKQAEGRATQVHQRFNDARINLSFPSESESNGQSQRSRQPPPPATHLSSHLNC